MIERVEVFLDDPNSSKIIADLKNRGFVKRSSSNQAAPVTGEYFPPFELWENIQPSSTPNTSTTGV